LRLTPPLAYGSAMAFASPADLSPIPQAEAPRDCPLCPRLVRLREELRAEYPAWWNAPVPVFGDPEGWIAIVGLAPGRKGANRTGRPFTGDYSGEIFYSTLLKFDLAKGEYRGDVDDGVKLEGAVVLNAVKCLPPANKPTPEEIATCGHYLEAALANCQECGWSLHSGRSHTWPRQRPSAYGPDRSSRMAPRPPRSTDESCSRPTIARGRTRTPAG
jgi:hypothetical protein